MSEYNYAFQSTHPRWDETGNKSFFLPFFQNFNPLIPGGMRLRWLVMRMQSENFNPLIPGGMRPHPVPPEDKTTQFQSTHPGWDETLTVWNSRRLEACEASLRVE